MTSIAIVDYGSGNLRSVQKAFERLGAAATITSDPDVVGAAERVVLPGVGAFADAIAALAARGLVAPLVAHGANHPLVSNATAAGRARNRRVELVIYPDRAAVDVAAK